MLTTRLADSARAQAAGAPRRKPLYLATRSPLRVGAEGESLVVRRAQGQPQRFPVARIDRIVCNTHADWSGQALVLCLAHGVTLTWVGGDGCVLGDACPRIAEASTLDAALESYLETPRWPVTYGNWLQRRRMSVVVNWARARAANGSTVERDDWETLKREFVYKGTIQAVLPSELNGWCHALTVARLRAAGLNSRYWGYDGQALELAEDLAALLWAAMNMEAGTLLGSAQEPRTLAVAFEAGVRVQEERLRDHLAHLRRHVARALEAWL